MRLAELASDRLLLHDRDHAPIIYDKIFELYAAAGVTPHIVATTASPASPGGMINVASGKDIYLGLGSLMTLSYFLFSAKQDSVGVLQNLFPAFTALYSLHLDIKHRGWKRDKASH